MTKLYAFLIAITFVSFGHAIDKRHVANVGWGVIWPKYHLSDADQTPVWTDKEKNAMQSTTTLTDSDFTPVALSKDDVALATTTFNVTLKGNSLVGDDLVSVYNALTSKDSSLQSLDIRIKELKKFEDRETKAGLDFSKEKEKMTSEIELIKRVYSKQN